MLRYSSSLLNSGEAAYYHAATLGADLSSFAESLISLLNDWDCRNRAINICSLKLPMQGWHHLGEDPIPLDDLFRRQVRTSLWIPIVSAALITTVCQGPKRSVFRPNTEKLLHFSSSYSKNENLVKNTPSRKYCFYKGLKVHYYIYNYKASYL